MSYADKKFIELCTDILENGTTDEKAEVRPHWEDGTPAHTKRIFGVMTKYDLRKEFPAITLRKTAIKSATDEVLWIYQKKSNNIKDLHSHIWDEWADKDGSIGKAYGYQVGKKYIHHYSNKVDYGVMLNGTSYDTVKYVNKQPVKLDQMDAVLYDLKNNPFSRRIMTNLYNFEDLYDMDLYPCAYSCQFNVSDEGYDKPVLSLLLNQRSQDVLAANNWNVCQYAVLLMMIAQCVDMIPGNLIHCIGNAHIYDRHIAIIKKLINREQYPAPKVTLNPDIHDFYQFTRNDITVTNYITGEQIKDIPIAI